MTNEELVQFFEPIKEKLIKEYEGVTITEDTRAAISHACKETLFEHGVRQPFDIEVVHAGDTELKVNITFPEGVEIPKEHVEHFERTEHVAIFLEQFRVADTYGLAGSVVHMAFQEIGPEKTVEFLKAMAYGLDEFDI